MRILMLMIVLTIILIGSLIVWCAMQPTCEERGGHLVQEGYYTQMIMVGKVTVPQVRPYYVCKGAKE